MGYRISVALAGVSLAVAVVAWMIVPFVWDPAEDGSWATSAQVFMWVGVVLVGPVLLALVLCVWKSPIVRPFVPVLALLYSFWTIAWALSFIGLLFWPAALVLLAACLIRAFSAVPSRPSITGSEPNDGTWGATKRNRPDRDLLTFLRGED